MKVLWVKQSVPDNHVGPTFLSQLKRNQNVVQYQLSTVVHDASVLLVNMTLAIIFLLSFVTIYKYEINPRLYVVAASLGDVVLAYKFIRGKPLQKRSAAFKTALVTIVMIMVLTPVLRSLTESTSSDSIWAICGWLLLLNVLVSSRSSPTLSTNTALAATIVLASRLKTSLDVFYFVFFNIETFVTLPLAFKWLRYKENSDVWSYTLIGAVSIGSWALIVYVIGYTMLIFWLVVQISVLLGIPLLFLSLQKHKDRISGPWDRAQPILD